jgi:ATP-dependent DNA ligase
MEPWLSPMLCGKIDAVPDGEFAIEGKLDGWRAVTYLRPSGDLVLYGGRNGNSYSGQVPYIEEQLLKAMPKDSAFDGELIGGGSGNFSYVQSLMTQGIAHVPNQHLPALSYVLFDVTRLDGEDLRSKPWHDRRMILEGLFTPLGLAHVRLSPWAPASQEAHDSFLALGLEGSVLKRMDSRYVNGRSNAWLKIKPQETCEAKVVGFKPGKKGTRWDGKVGAFKIELLDNGAETTVKCGTDDRHEDATANPHKWLNKVIEIKHHGLGDKGVPRHPQFLRIREDRVESARERQIRELLAEEANPTPAPTPKPKAPRVSAPRSGGSGRMRNYGAMGQAKLEGCVRELRAQSGDAYNRCVNGGSGNPAGDLRVAEQALQSKYGVTV